MAQFYAVQTTSGQEEAVVEGIMTDRVPGVYAALAPAQMNSYVIVEAEELRLVEESIQTLHHAKKVLPGETSFREVEGFLAPKSRIEGVHEGDLVEITDGAYKGDKARVQRIDQTNEKVTVELHEAPIPIPVEINGDQIRVIEG